MVGTLDGNLCPLGFARVWWFDNFLDNSGESRARFLIHKHFHRARGDQIQFSTNVTHPGQVEPPRRVPLDKSEGEGWWPTQARFWLEWGCSTSQTCSRDKLSSSSCHGDWRVFSRMGSHFVTFCCDHRRCLLTTDASCRIFESALGWVRRRYGLYVYAYVVMPEHIHLL